MPAKERLKMIDKQYKALSMSQQCKILEVNRSNIYYKLSSKDNGTLLANEIHDIWLEFPTYGYRKITAKLKRREYNVNHKKSCD